MKNLSNISVRDLRELLASNGLECIRTNGGHEAWARKGMLRPVIFQTHVEPVPEFVVKNIIGNLGMTRQEFLDMLEKQ